MTARTTTRQPETRGQARAEAQVWAWFKARGWTPLAFPIMVDRLRSRVSSEKLAARVRRMQLRLEKKTDGE